MFTCLVIEEERRSTDQLKDQLDKTQNSIKRNKREMDALEEENSNLKAYRRRLQRDLDEATEAREAAERDLATLRKLSRGPRSSRIAPSRISARTGDDGSDDMQSSLPDIDLPSDSSVAPNHHNTSGNEGGMA
ncbi:unnamed protein product [Protopolystoma xenopodis]|uniref:Myosin tail domain-containing protein n=1 Tax=Protopolystoma xenopodis TaxID=117903 RepID=A0A3S5AE01_9PLAT|nr:unnamed protein product [Protopolystoma xenopodis]